MAAATGRVIIRYRSHRGTTANRVIQPLTIWFGKTEWHPEEQWFLDGWDVDRNARRSFALRDILEWDI